MEQIDLNLLAQLAVLLQTRSVTRAAASTGISQPAMSRALAELRRLFGDPLLVRTSGGMLLTQRAEELAKPLQDWLAQVNHLLLPNSFDPATLVRRFRVIAGDHSANAVVMPALAAVMEMAPGAAIDVLPEGGDPRERLASGEADLAVSTLPKDRHLIHDRLLTSEEYLCLLRGGHPLLVEAETRELALADFLCWPHLALSCAPMHDPFSGRFAPAGLERRIVATLPSVAAGAALLAASEAILFAPASAVRPHACGRRLSALPAPAELGRHEHWALWHNRTHRDPAIRWLIDLLADHCQKTPTAANDLGDRLLTLAAAE